MKIRAVEPLPIDRFLYVQVHTDAGIVGLGESGTWGHLEASEAALRKFGDYLVGQDPFRIEHHWNVMYRSGHFRGAAIPNLAIQELPDHVDKAPDAQIVKENLRVEKGFLIIPDAPGIGVELAPDAREKLPPKPRPIGTRLNFDGSVVDQ